MLTWKIMLSCIHRLISSTDDEESIECLCKLLTTIGKKYEAETVYFLSALLSLLQFSFSMQPFAKHTSLYRKAKEEDWMVISLSLNF